MPMFPIAEIVELSVLYRVQLDSPRLFDCALILLATVLTPAGPFSFRPSINRLQKRWEAGTMPAPLLWGRKEGNNSSSYAP